MPADVFTPFEILLVEDRDDDADWAMQALKPEGARWRVTRAEDGEEALARLLEAVPALMLLDLSMPKKTGLEVLREIRGSDNPDLKNLPVVILTTSREFSDVQEALNLKAASFMTKPIKLQDLREAVKKILPDLPDSEKLRKFAEEMARMG
jgi:two-component system response regulator